VILFYNKTIFVYSSVDCQPKMLIFELAFVVTPLDATCRKKQKSPCTNGQAPLAGYFCGRGPTRQDCPSTHEYITAPNDAYAVYCPHSQQDVTTPAQEIEKPGS
jgi:hypothetical protein